MWVFFRPNWGQAATLLGAVFGPASVANKQLVGIALTLLDGGWGYEQLAAAAVGVTGKSSHADVAALLDNGMSVDHLAALAADLSINTSNINLVGLAQTGIEFV